MSLPEMSSYGLETVARWVRTVLAGQSDPTLWTVLDDRLRLTLTQGWVLDTLGSPDDDLAEDLADEDTDAPHFSTMFEHLVGRWRSTYADLQGEFDVFDRAHVIGADMELLVLANPDYAGGFRTENSIPTHYFIVRFENDECKIAALARRIPVPGWPPTEQIVPGLEFS